jgi:predicted alpha/beta superfamily hydrolase
MPIRGSRVYALAAVAMVGFAATVVAQAGIKVPAMETHRLYSKEVGDSFEIRVLMPPMIPGETTRFPVVYLTDTNGGFIIDGDEMRLMMLGDTPRYIAVGIGYPNAPSILQTLSIRARDLTPVVDNEADVGAGMPFAGMIRPAVTTGGAPKFLAFIRDQLIPFIDARYPTDPKDRAYWGDSLGGLFGCYVLFTKPDTFNRYIIGSPSLWWANENMLQVAEQFTKTHDDLAATVFMGIGGLEEGNKFRMTTNMLRLERLLRSRKYPGLQLTTRVFPDETHTTVAPMNLIRGLVAVFGPPAPGQGMFEKYAQLAKRR